MPIITEEGFDTLQESTVVVETDSVPKVDETEQKVKVNQGQGDGKSEDFHDDDESDKGGEHSQKVLQPQSMTEKSDIPGDLVDDEEDLDETLAERLWGLTEMFPERLRIIVSSAAELSQALVKGSYSFGCNATWVLASSATILVLPVLFELERAQMEQQQLQQQRQILLGPNAASSGMAGMPGFVPVQPR